LISTKSEVYTKIAQDKGQITTNQNDFDITYYFLDLKPNPETSVLTGVVSVEGKINSSSLDHIELNFWNGMNILDIHLTQNPENQLYYTHNDDILYISLDRTYQYNEKFSVTIGYNGQPQNSPYNSFDFGIKDGKPMIWTLSQPYGARAWWPCKDTPSDKADSVDIRVTVPDDLIVVANGKLLNKTISGGEAVYWWRERYPIVTYLISLAIHPYIVSYDDFLYNNKTDTMKIHFYMFEENYEQYFDINAQTKHMMALYTDLFGPYPFLDEKYAHADFLGGGAMEHQTCSSFGFWNEWVVAHELAHQWWGDYITCENFNHIWLNEGFATYCEALWYEHLNGPGTASYYQMTTNLYLEEGTIYVEDPQNEDIFDGGLSYRKASWVLHMLRHVVGDDMFYDIMKTYYSSDFHKYNNATTQDFQMICEQISGIKLDKFFNQWIYEEYYPRYSINWNWTEIGSNYEIELQIKQEQKNHLFWMPIDVTITTRDGEYTFIAWDSLESQNFSFVIPSEPLSLQIDKDDWILKTVQEQIVNPTFNRGILLVNGVDFDAYGAPIRAAYESKAFWGDFPISFWDCFNPPEEDYPSTLPDPLGFGRIPAEVLKQFSTVIWIGNNYQGDINSWLQTSILPYLNSGGNIFLISRHGQDFIDEDMRQYLGINWAENTTNTLANCISDFTGLVSMAFTDVQSSNAVFDIKFSDDESTLIFKETISFSGERAMGVWKKPGSGGVYRPDGGQFVFISGRPYRFINQELRVNCEYILENFFGESKISAIAEEDNLIIKMYRLSQNYPNPFNPRTIINYELPITNYVELNIFNILGQKVAILVSEKQEAGKYQVHWNGSGFPSGIYYYRIKAASFEDVKKMILIK
jgi:hypothetical protein